MARLLVVEDDPFVRTSAIMYLADAGFPTLEADRFSAAILLLEKHRDITHVFSDVMLVGEPNGLSLAQVIGRRWPDVRVLVTSGALPTSDQAIPANVAFMAKPYDLDRVVHWVEDTAQPET